MHEIKKDKHYETKNSFMLNRFIHGILFLSRCLISNVENCYFLRFIVNLTISAQK